MSKKYIKPMTYFLVVALATFVIYVSFPRNSVSISDQPRGFAVHIDNLSLPKGGFVQFTIHPQEPENPGVQIGISEYLPAGRYRDFNVVLNENKFESFGNYSNLVATIYLDNGDGAFDQESDRAVKWKIVKIN